MEVFWTQTEISHNDMCNSNDVKKQDVCGIFQSGFVYTEGKSA